MKKIFFQIVLIFFIVLANKNNLIATDGASEQGITQDDFLEFAKSWFDTISKDCKVEDQAKLFILGVDAKLYLLEDGMALDLYQHYEFHQKLTNESFRIVGNPIISNPSSPVDSRCVHVSCVISWTAELFGSTSKSITILAGEDWILRRDESGKIKFVVLMNKYHKLSEGSCLLPKISSSQRKVEGSL
jgi:hypothetical protein